MDAVWDMAFLPDDCSAIAVSQDEYVIVWGLERVAGLARYRPSRTGLFSVVVSADGRLRDDLLTWFVANRYVPELTCQQRVQYCVEPLCEEKGAPWARTSQITSWPATESRPRLCQGSAVERLQSAHPGTVPASTRWHEHSPRQPGHRASRAWPAR